MFLFDRISKKIAHIIAGNLDMDKDHEEVIAYGAFGLLQILWCILLVIIFGAIFGVLLESLIVSFSISILRKYSGGVHASTPGRCAFIGTVVSVGFALLVHYSSKYLVQNIVSFIVLVCFFVCFIIVYRKAPVDSAAKPIKKAEKKRHLKARSLIVLGAFLFLVLVMQILYFKYRNILLTSSTLSLCAGILWQSFTLTSIGDKILTKVDSALFVL